jgi:hypothetical protein
VDGVGKELKRAVTQSLYDAGVEFGIREIGPKPMQLPERDVEIVVSTKYEPARWAP